jgi:Bacterial DNA polymerase III alpha NTPase domain
MRSNQYGEIILDETDLCDLIMQGRDLTQIKCVIDHSVDIELAIQLLEDPGQLVLWTFSYDSDISVPDWDNLQQRNWHMPDEYRQLDIAEYVVAMCDTEEKLQRVGQELLLYQERGLFDLLRYLKYLVDVMHDNHVIWGVGRGSSVASYVLYLLGVHRIDSMYYDLDAQEFLR